MDQDQIRQAHTNRPFIQLHAAVFLFGAAGLFGKLVALPALVIVLGRVFFAALALGIWITASGRKITLEKKGDVVIFAVLGALLAFHWTAFFMSIQITTVAVGVLTFATFPAFTVLLEPLFFREKLSVKNLGLAGLCFLGVFLIVPQAELWGGGQMEPDFVAGVLWGLASGLSFSYLSLINKKHAGAYGGIRLAFYQCAFATVFALPSLWLYPEVTLGPQALGWLILLGVVFTGLAHSLFIQAMRDVKAQTASLIAAMEPVYGIVLAWLVLREVPAPSSFAGGVLILLAVGALHFQKDSPNT